MKTTKIILEERDLYELGIWDRYKELRAMLYKSSDRDNCIVIQGAAFVVRGYAFLLMGVGGIDFLDSLARNKKVDGIIGNGNALFIRKDFKYVYSAHTREELIKSYELEGYNEAEKYIFIDEAPIGPLIFLMRSFKDAEEYNRTKNKYYDDIVFDVADTFGRKPLKFSGSLKARLRSKFIKTARVVHCARRPTLLEKECIFDSFGEIRDAVNQYTGKFALIYTLWNQLLCDIIGMRNTRALPKSHNKIDMITPKFVDIIENELGVG